MYSIITFIPACTFLVAMPTGIGIFGCGSGPEAVVIHLNQTYPLLGDAISSESEKYKLMRNTPIGIGNVQPNGD